jgi:hypothetical protein
VEYVVKNDRGRDAGPYRSYRTVVETVAATRDGRIRS